MDARKEARRAIRFGEEKKEANQSNLGVMLVEEYNGNAILRSVMAFQPTEPLSIPIPYRDYCAYTFTNG